MHVREGALEHVVEEQPIREGLPVARVHRHEPEAVDDQPVVAIGEAWYDVKQGRVTVLATPPAGGGTAGFVVRPAPGALTCGARTRG